MFIYAVIVIVIIITIIMIIISTTTMFIWSGTHLKVSEVNNMNMNSSF